MLFFLRALLVTSVAITFNIHAQFFEEEKKENQYLLSICAVFKNEANYLKEWIEYHLLVGVDHFYLYNIGSQDRYLKILDPYIKKGIVTLVDWINGDPSREDKLLEWSLGIQIPAYENAIHYLGRGQTKWLTFIDVDEYLVPSTADSILYVLEEYKDGPAIDLGCDFFDVSKNFQILPKRKLLIQTVELTKPVAQNPQREISKLIFKPDQCKGFTWAPYRCVFRNLQVAKNVAKSKLRINHYLNRDAYSPFRKRKEKFHIDNRFVSDEDLSQILSLDYEIEDQEQAISRFIPKLAEKMGVNIHWGW